jgi:hypothetical protein
MCALVDRKEGGFQERTEEVKVMHNGVWTRCGLVRVRHKRAKPVPWSTSKAGDSNGDHMHTICDVHEQEINAKLIQEVLSCIATVCAVKNGRKVHLEVARQERSGRWVKKHVV